MKVLRAALTICAKDLRIFTRDRMGLLLSFALPAALVLVFGFLMSVLFSSDNGGMGKVELWVVDEDGSEESRSFLVALRGADLLSVRPRVDEAGVLSEKSLDGAALRARILDGDAHHALLIEAGFGAALRGQAEPPLRLLRDPGREMESQLVSFGLAAAWLQETQGRGWIHSLERQMRAGGMSEAQLALLRQASEAQYELIRGQVEADEKKADADESEFEFSNMMSGLVPLTEENLAPPDRDEDANFMKSQSVAGIAVMMLMFGLVACGATLIQEREGGTLRRLLALPVPAGALLLGKFFFVFTIGLVQLIFLFTLGEVVFDIGIGRDPLTLLIHSIAVAAAVTAFGILVAAWARTQKQAEGVSTLIILVMSCLGGAWFPLQQFPLPGFVETAMKCTLTHWAVSGYQGIFWSNLSWSDPVMLRKTGVLLGFTLVAGLAARALFRARYLGRR
jgi:ABC-2 type transport system permease protein